MEIVVRDAETAVHRRSKETACSAHEGAPGLQVQAAQEAQAPHVWRSPRRRRLRQLPAAVLRRAGARCGTLGRAVIPRRAAVLPAPAGPPAVLQAHGAGGEAADGVVVGGGRGVLVLLVAVHVAGGAAEALPLVAVPAVRRGAGLAGLAAAAQPARRPAAAARLRHILKTNLPALRDDRPSRVGSPATDGQFKCYRL